MKPNRTVLAMMLVTMVAACSNIERTRNLADPSVSAKTLAEQVCSNCHGHGGRSINPNFPNLAAQQPDYFVKELTEFRSHSRSDPAGFEYMWGLSRSLTDEQIAGLAAYYAAQSPATPESSEASASVASASVAEGRDIFENGIASKNVPPCKSCHGAEAQGQAGFPRLANQHADYIVKQLLVFQRTDERPEGSIMKTVAHDLTKQNIESVALFLQGLSAK